MGKEDLPDVEERSDTINGALDTVHRRLEFAGFFALVVVTAALVDAALDTKFKTWSGGEAAGTITYLPKDKLNQGIPLERHFETLYAQCLDLDKAYQYHLRLFEAVHECINEGSCNQTVNGEKLLGCEDFNKMAESLFRVTFKCMDAQEFYEQNKRAMSADADAIAWKYNSLVDRVRSYKTFSYTLEDCSPKHDKPTQAPNVDLDGGTPI